jgi:peptide/nickel transport system substrate-binding protein
MVEYEALDQHWRQTAAFKKLTIIKIPEAATKVAVLKTGTVDIIDAGIPDAQELETLGYKIANLATQMSVVNLHGAYAPQNAGKPLADIRVRQALSLAINRDEIIKNFYLGKASFPMPPYLFDISADIDIPYWREYGTKLNLYDTTEAKRLLTEAGYPQGFSIRLWSFAQSTAQDLPQLCQVVQAYWLQIGVKAEIYPVDYSIYSSKTNELKSLELIGQAACYSVGASSVTVQRLRAGFHTTGTFALLNKAFPEVEKVLDDVMSETDASKRKDMLAPVIKTCADTYTQLPIAYVPSLVVISPKVKINIPKPADCSIGYYLDIAQHAK